LHFATVCRSFDKLEITIQRFGWIGFTFAFGAPPKRVVTTVGGWLNTWL